MEGAKARPCAIVVAMRREGARTEVIVVPVTHSAPVDPSAAMRLPDSLKRPLGLDANPSWIVLDEVNVFAWPGPDLRPAPDSGAESVAFGTLPPRFFRQLRERIVLLGREGRIRRVPRPE